MYVLHVLDRFMNEIEQEFSFEKNKIKNLQDKIKEYEEKKKDYKEKLEMLRGQVDSTVQSQK